MQHIHWMLPGNYPDLDQLRVHNLASVRMRAAIALDACWERKIKFTAGEIIPTTVTQVVVGKIGSMDVDQRSKAWLAELSSARAEGITTLVDYTDHHIGFKSVMSDFYAQVLKQADRVVCPSRQMQSMLHECLAEICGRTTRPDIRIVADAIEVAISAPKTRINNPVNMLWFGHQSNISYLAKFLTERLPVLKLPKNLLILTNEQGLQAFQHLNPKVPSGLTVQIAPWSISHMQKAAQYCDLCLIPSDPNDPRKSGVSPNRLITAFALGLPTAADNLNAYSEYRDYYIDLDSQELSRFLSHPESYHQKLSAAQQQVVPHYFPGNIKKNWSEVLNMAH
jgi:hypothetical protein